MDIFTEIFSLPIIGLLFFAALSVCANTFTILTLKPNSGLKLDLFLIVYEIFIFGMIFIPCFHANTIKYQSDKFLYDLFSSDWIDSLPEHQKFMIIFSENLKRKIIFQTLTFIEIDLQLFMDLIQFVYSMYAVFKSII
ncbi:hypothetical protein ACKWTF_006387 [Chironomus riparius]